MTNNKKLFSFIIIIFTILAGITAAIIYFAYNITKFTTYAPNTTIGSYYIGGLYGDEAKKELNVVCQEWNETASVNLMFQDYIINLNNNNFVFDIDSSINKVSNGKTNKLYVDFKADNQNYIDNVISLNQNVLKFNNFDNEKIKVAILQKVSLLQQNITIDMGKYIKDYNTNRIVVNSLNINNINNAKFLQFRFFNLLKEIEIKPKEQFSLTKYVNEALKDSQDKFTDEELSILATGIYQLVIQSNFNNISKNISKELPIYTSTGLEAYINQSKNYDLSFYNPNSYSYYIYISHSDNKMNTLTFDLLGLDFVNVITYNIETKILNPSEIYWYYTTWNGRELADDEEIYLPTGSEGYRSYVIRTIRNFDNTVSNVIISEDIYMPKDIIIIKKPNSN